MTIKNVLDTLNNLSIITKKTMPATVTYALLKNIKQLEAEQQCFIELQDTLLNECVEKPEDGSYMAVEDSPNKYVLKEDKVQYYNDDIKKIMSIETTVDIHKIPFANIANLNLSLEEMAALEFMIEEE